MSRTGSSGPSATCGSAGGGRSSSVLRAVRRIPGGVAYSEVVERPQRLVVQSTMSMPDGSTVDTRTRVTFTETADGHTRLTVVQSGFPAAGLRDEFTDSWGSILGRSLARVVAARTA